MGIETSDVTFRTWQHSSSPIPLPEPRNFDVGRPVIQGLQHDPDEPIFRTVGQAATISMIVKGEKNIKVTMFEERFDDNNKKRELGVMTLRCGDAGFTVSINCRTPDTYKLIFEATNSRGTAIAYVYLMVHGRNDGG
ncbi:hypothetical protein BSL78_22521 [Apostichopus japonicus]|uniref:Uncharacterized protein n=1 Tax=Stichopus japonicus TaxID=307972 RepID=A0A2G8JY12_STIJA|nr:hypothetical protein BSL78_22521 [Apostichopus japonicus]